MDTIYYTANFRTVKVAGGEDRVRVYLVPEVRSKGSGALGTSLAVGQRLSRQAELAPPRPMKDNIVNLEMARARVERKQAWKALVDAAWG